MAMVSTGRQTGGMRGSDSPWVKRNKPALIFIRLSSKERST